MLDSVWDGNINIYNPEDKVQFKQIFLNREEDKQKYEEFKKLFQSFWESEQKMLVCERYPRYFLTYIMNQLSSDVRKKIYFENIDKIEDG